VQERWLNGNRLFFGATDVHTDDRGQFRLVLPPGHYYLTAGVREPDGAAVLREAPDKPEMRIAAQYYPAASSIDSASPVELRPGQQLTGMDFRLPAVPTYHVRGVVAVPGMQPPDRLSLRNRNGDMVRGSAYSAVLKGSFDIAGVSPGSYWVEFGSDHPVTMRKTRIDVTDHDVDGIQLAPMAPFGVKLRVRFEEDSLPHPYAQLMLSSLEPLAIGFHTFSSDVGEVFQGPFGCGEYVLKLTPDSDVYVKSVTYAGRPIAGNKIDMSNGPAGLIEAVLATGTGAVTGTVADSQALWALLVSADDDTGNSGVRLAELDATGQFKISFVPPGKWLVFSIQNLDVPHWENRAYVQEMAGRGTPVVVEKGVTAHVEIKP
jgi:hypothetical protein